MRRMKRKLDSDTQTDIQCMPHVLKMGETAKVQSNQVTQTVASASPSLDDIDFYPDLERVDVKDIHADALQIIKYRRYRKLHFKLPSGIQLDFSSSGEQLADGLTEAEAYDLYVDEILAAATPRDSPSVTPRTSAVATAASIPKVNMKSLRNKVTSKPYSILKPVEVEHAEFEIECAHVQIQTRLMVFPHFLRVNERATVSTEITTQTDVTCNPQCSLTEVIPKLRSYLQHDGREIVAGDTIENKSILDIIKGLLESVEETHKHMFDGPLPTIPIFPNIPCKTCSKDETKKKDACTGECATEIIKPPPAKDQCVLPVCPEEQNMSVPIVESIPTDEAVMNMTTPEQIGDSNLEETKPTEENITAEVTAQVVPETAEAVAQDLSVNEKDSSVDAAANEQVLEAGKGDVAAKLEMVVVQLEQVATQMQVQDASAETSVKKQSQDLELGGNKPPEQGKQLCVNRKDCQDCICSGLKIKLFINNIGLTSANDLRDKTCLLLNILPGLDKIEVQAIPTEQKEESIDEDECDSECCASASKGKYSPYRATKCSSFILPDGRKTKCPKIIRRLQIKDKDKAVDQPKKAIEVPDKEEITTSTLTSTTENMDEDGLDDFGLVIFEETTVQINLQDDEEQSNPTTEDTKPQDEPQDSENPPDEDEGKNSDYLQSINEESVESATAEKVSKDIARADKEKSSCNCDDNDDNVFEVIYDKEPKELPNLEFCEQKIVKKRKSREVLPSKAFSISNLLDGAIVALVSKNPEGFNVQLNINNDQNSSASNEQQISKYQGKENDPNARSHPCSCNPRKKTQVCQCGLNINDEELHIKSYGFSDDEYETCSEGPNSARNTARSKNGQDANITVPTPEQTSTVAKLTLPDNTVVNIKVTLDMDELTNNDNEPSGSHNIKSVTSHASRSAKQVISVSSVKTGIFPHKSPKYVDVNEKSAVSILGNAPKMSELNSILFTESSRTINILSPSMLSTTSFVSLQPIFVQHTPSGGKKLEKGNVIFNDDVKINPVPSDVPSVFLKSKNIIKITAAKSAPSVQKSFHYKNGCSTKTCEFISAPKPNLQNKPCSCKPTEPIKSVCTLKSCKFTAKPVPEKQDMLYLAFKTCEEELKPIQDAFLNLRKELRMLNMPEVNCIFNKAVSPSLNMPRFTPFQKKVRQLNLEDMKKSEEKSFLKLKFTSSGVSQCSEEVTNVRTKVTFNYVNPDAAPQITPISSYGPCRASCNPNAKLKPSQNYCFSSFDSPMSKSAIHSYGTQKNYDSAYYSYSNSPKTDVSYSCHNRIPSSSSCRRPYSNDSNHSGRLRQTTSVMRDLKDKKRPCAAKCNPNHSSPNKSTRFQGVSSHSMCPNISSSYKYSGSSASIASSASNVSSRVSSEEFICPAACRKCHDQRGKKRKYCSRTSCVSYRSSTASVCPLVEVMKQFSSPRKKQCSNKDSK